MLEAEGPMPPGLAVRRPSDHLRLLLIWLALLAIPFAAPNAYVVSLANMALINLILIASLNLLMGYGGQISLGHAGFFGLGAYASGILNVKLGLSAWLGLPAAALIAAVAALVIGLPALRLRGHYLSMATLGWNAILVVLFNQLVSLTGGPNGLLGVQPFSLAGIKLDTEPRAFPLVWLTS
jgi:branched-chain amino acid transport system permease protein